MNRRTRARPTCAGDPARPPGAATMVAGGHDMSRLRRGSLGIGLVTILGGFALAVLLAAGASAPARAAWEPSKPIEFIIPAGTGGGADQMARLIAGIADKHKLSPRPFIVVNKSGGAGAEGFLNVKR